MLQLSESDQENLLKEFPNIKLSYKNIIYKKVNNYDVILAIPEGKKCFAWFTELNDKNVCIIMEIAPNKQIMNIKITNACFSDELSYGTILYGTIFNYKSNNFFTIEDIFYLKGKSVENECWGHKFNIFINILKNDLKQISYNNTFLVFGLSLISSDRNDLMQKITNVSYKIENIEFRSYNKINNFETIKYSNFIDTNFVDFNKENLDKPIMQKPIMQKPIIKKPKSKNTVNNRMVFKIKPDIQFDIYYLYCLNERDEEEFYNIAHIPDYKTSVFMNNLFRNIKENANLDALEESDDEEEFENDREDKYVYLKNEYNIECVYNYKFKKWVPIKLADIKAKIVLKRDLSNY